MKAWPHHHHYHHTRTSHKLNKRTSLVLHKYTYLWFIYIQVCEEQRHRTYRYVRIIGCFINKAVPVDFVDGSSRCRSPLHSSNPPKAPKFPQTPKHFTKVKNLLNRLLVFEMSMCMYDVYARGGREQVPIIVSHGRNIHIYIYDVICVQQAAAVDSVDAW